ncbi:MAG TPA: PilZ domain-containing protein [Alphaproteobacteria bacterium]|nr:PilZ domain-containing protein [Alphaproteobacteria bacterium]
MIDSLAPVLAAIGAVILITSTTSRLAFAPRAVFAGLITLFIARYVWWRWTATMNGYDTLSLESAWAWFWFGFETLLLLDTVFNMVVFSRHIARTTQADDGERWIRERKPEHLPSVDVLIPTYNEGLDVLERSIVGALSLDYPKFTVWVLDDGRRPWLAEFCAAKGARYLTRPDNNGAKAGNINAALKTIKGDLVAVLDADFVPRRNFLLRTVGFFRDPAIACIQTPQTFFNKDPVQTNLGLGANWSDDQRLFYDMVMPSRDAWGAAFCCGSGCVFRRASLDAVGGQPTASVCEDMLLSILFLRQGQRTIYLNEPLCIGLAPESLAAFFVQRKRWCRGNIQMLFLKIGQFGPGLTLWQRLLFLPTYWALQLPSRMVFLFVPLIYLWTGVAPLSIPDQGDLVAHIAPVMICAVSFICWIAPGAYFPILSDATNLLIAARIAPTALSTFIKPFGEPFRVTPKGRDARAASHDRVVFRLMMFVLLGSMIGLAWNGFLSYRPIEDTSAFPFAAGWAVFNCIIVSYAALIARERMRYRAQERFPLGIAAALSTDTEVVPCVVVDASASGAFIRFGNKPVPHVGNTVRVACPSIGTLSGRVVRTQGDGAAIRFADLTPATREALSKLFVEQIRGATNKSGRKAIRRRLNASAACTAGSAWSVCTVIDASLSGALLSLPSDMPVAAGGRITVDLPDIGIVEATVMRASPQSIGVQFEDMSPDVRDRLIRFLYTAPEAAQAPQEPLRATTIIGLMGRAAFGPEAA